MATGTINTGQVNISQPATINTHVMNKEQAEQSFLRFVHKNLTQVGNVGAGEDDLMSYTIPANALDVGSVLIIEGKIKLANNANNKTIKAFLGATTLFTLGPIATADVLVSVRITIAVLTATTQNVMIEYVYPTVTQTVLISTAADTTVANTLKFAGEGTSNDDVLQKALIITLLT